MEFPMQQTLRADRPTEQHPSREHTDHANIDPRRHPKHPKSDAPRPRGGDRPGAR
jgi:hypothetical protein